MSPPKSRMPGTRAFRAWWGHRRLGHGHPRWDAPDPARLPPKYQMTGSWAFQPWCGPRCHGGLNHRPSHVPNACALGHFGSCQSHGPPRFGAPGLAGLPNLECPARGHCNAGVGIGIGACNAFGSPTSLPWFLHCQTSFVFFPAAASELNRLACAGKVLLAQAGEVRRGYFTEGPSMPQN